MVSALHSRLGGLGLSTGRVGSVLGPLSSQVYKGIPANLMLGVPCDELASQPGGGGGSSSLYATETRISSGLMGRLAHM